MYLFLKELFIFSLLGAVFWIFLTIFSPISNYLFSQTWNYYIRLISTFCLLGFFKIIALPFKLLHKEKSFNYPLIKLNINNSNNVNFIVLCFFLVWIIGFFLFLIIKIKNYIKFLSFIKNTSQYYTIFDKKILILKNFSISTPMLIGIKRPIIILPNVKLEKKQLEFILKHELIHYQRKDIIIRFFIMLSNAIHWFNPLVYKLNKSIYYFCETSCDEILVKNMSIKEKKNYGQTILYMLELDSINKSNLTIGLCENTKNIKRRLSYMIKPKKSKHIVISIIIACMLLTSGSIITYAISDTNTKINNSSKNTNDKDPVSDYSLPVYGDNGKYFGTYKEYIQNYNDNEQESSNQKNSNDEDPILDYSLPVYGDNGEYFGTYEEYIQNYE